MVSKAERIINNIALFIEGSLLGVIVMAYLDGHNKETSFMCLSMLVCGMFLRRHIV